MGNTSKKNIKNTQEFTYEKCLCGRRATYRCSWTKPVINSNSNEKGKVIYMDKHPKYIGLEKYYRQTLFLPHGEVEKYISCEQCISPSLKKSFSYYASGWLTSLVSTEQFEEIM
jgi:hypothetical protein